MLLVPFVQAHTAVSASTVDIPRRLAPGRIVDRAVEVYLTADVRSLAAGRVVMALVLLLDLAKRWAEIGLWYTNDGLLPNHTLLWRPSFSHAFSLFLLASRGYEAAVGFVLCGAAYTMLLVGFHTRLAQVLSLICLLSLHGRLLLFDNGGDVVLGLVCLWTTFLPTGRRWSVDAVLAGRPAAARSATSLGVLALTFQLALIYFFNAVHKQGASWREGSAVYYVLHLDRLATGFAVWVRGVIPFELCKLLTWGTLAIEWTLPLLLLSPFAVRYTRRLAIVLVVVLHGGFALCMNLGSFVPAMLAFTPNFVHRDDWDALERWWARAPRRAHSWARARTRICALVLRVAAALTPGRRVRVTGPGPLAQAFARRIPFARELTVVGCIMVATSQLLEENRAAHVVIEHHKPPAIDAAVIYLNLFQGWSMFAPDAPMTDFNVVVDAVTVDGRHVDPFNEVANPRHPAPGIQIPEHLAPSWLFYGYENHLPSEPAYYQALKEWILRYHERTGLIENRIVSFRVLIVEDDSPPLGERAPRNLRSRELFAYP